MPKTGSRRAAAGADTNKPADAVARFEQSLGELEQLVTGMEEGELSLDQSLHSFERGIALYRSCQAALDDAEARVKLLLDPADPASATPLTPAKGSEDTDEDIPF